MKPPSLRYVTQLVRSINSAWDGGEFVTLARYGASWTLEPAEHPCGSDEHHGREWIPGDGQPLDAVAVARRLLAAYRDDFEARNPRVHPVDKLGRRKRAGKNWS